jgi:hypothetical protein
MKTSEVVRLWCRDLFYMGMIYNNVDDPVKKEKMLVRFNKIEEAILSFCIEDEEDEDDIEEDEE